MAFNTLETSEQGGQPVELYTFTMGADRLDYTSSDTEVTYQTRAYTPAALQRQAIEETAEISRSDLRITCAANFGPAEWFSPYPPSEVVSVEMRRLHRGDTEAELFWVGRLITVEWRDVTAELKCESLLAALRRPGLRRLYQRSCPHTLYGPGCLVASASYRHTATLSGISGTSLTSAAFASLGSGYLAGGYLVWQDGTRTERRAIRSHTAGTIVISHPIPNMATFATVTVYAGCAHTLATCNTKFSNAANYGGFPYVPATNPFGGNSVFY